MKIDFKILPLQTLLTTRGLEANGPVQKFIDNEVLKKTDPYVPLDKGPLKQSGIVHTKLGSGNVIYRTPYARVQYYENSNQQGLRGKLWFERMKADHRESILRGAMKVAGAK